MVDINHETHLLKEALPHGQPYEVASLSLAELEGDQSARSSFWLTPEEQQLYDRFNAGKRRSEWLGGRMAAKIAIARLLARPLPTVREQVAVLARPDGKPIVRTPLNNDIELSVSHSGGLAAALASFFPCGLDIQMLTTVVLKVQDRFSTSDERALLAELLSAPATVRLTLLWAAKEALRKAISGRPLAGFNELLLTKGTGAGTDRAVLSFTFTRWSAAEQFRAVVYLRNGFAWALAGHTRHLENHQ
ncbi:MAG: 4'-phosphopantetheinyl transferase superfamily protein [Deltaproteobacteria bacterium]